MATIDKVKPPRRVPSADSTELKGKAMLKMLAPSLQDRGVPSNSFVMINIVNGEFVTGKTREEAGQRFARMHPGAEGWLQRFGDVIGDPKPDAPLQESKSQSRRTGPDRSYAARSGRQFFREG